VLGEEDVTEDHDERHSMRSGLVDTSWLRRRSDVCCSREELPDWLSEVLAVRHTNATPCEGMLLTALT